MLKGCHLRNPNNLAGRPSLILNLLQVEPELLDQLLLIGQLYLSNVELLALVLDLFLDSF